MPALPLDPADYLTATRGLTATQHGVYLLLLLEIWRTGQKIPDGNAVLDRIVMPRSEDEQRALEYVCQHMLDLDENGWSAPFLTPLLAKVSATSAVRRTAIRKRWDKAIQKKNKSNTKVIQLNEVTHSKAMQEAPTAANLPDGVSESLWSEFLEMRRRIRKPATVRAQWLIIGRLANLQAETQSPARAMLQQSIRNGWQDVFPLRAESGK